MAEYIKKEDLYRKIAELEKLARNNFLETPPHSPTYPRYMAQFNERTQLKFLIADFPTADVVEVVRCKDCKYMEEDVLFKTMWCTNPSGSEVKAEEFCCRGERRKP